MYRDIPFTQRTGSHTNWVARAIHELGFSHAHIHTFIHICIIESNTRRLNIRIGLFLLVHGSEGVYEDVNEENLSSCEMSAYIPLLCNAHDVSSVLGRYSETNPIWIVKDVPSIFC